MPAAAAPETAKPITRRDVWRLAWPIMVANVSIPLLGLADTAVIGNVGTTASLGAIAIGAVLFNFLYWGFGFLRMGTTGLVAQAYGSGDMDELKVTLARALLIAWVLGLIIVVFQEPAADFAIPLFNPDPDIEPLARAYYDIRIWGAPATLANYALLGWFIGAQATRPVLALQLFLNLSNILLNLFFVLMLDMGVEGIALGTLIAEWITLFLGVLMMRERFVKLTGGILAAPLSWASVLDPAAMIRTFSVNFDIMIRTLLLIASFAWFTAMGSRLGSTTLAGNHILLQFLAFSAFFLDGWAIAAEGLVGRALGARNREALRRAVRLSTEMAVITSVGLTLLFFAGGPLAIRGLTDIEAVRQAAIAFLPFAALHPILGVWAFQLDGVFIGATRTAAMRNAMIASFALFMAAWWLLTPYGNSGLWIAFLGFFAARGITLALYYPGLERSAAHEPAPQQPR